MLFFNKKFKEVVINYFLLLVSLQKWFQPQNDSYDCEKENSFKFSKLKPNLPKILGYFVKKITIIIELINQPLELMTNIQARSSHDQFIEGVLSLKDYQPVLLSKVNNAKQKLDEVALLLQDDVPTEQLIRNNQELINSTTDDFDILQRVLAKLEKDNMRNFRDQKVLLIRTIRQQLKKFKKTLPDEEARQKLVSFSEKQKNRENDRELREKQKILAQKMDKKRKEVQKNHNKSILITVLMVVIVLILFGLVAKKSFAQAFGDL